MEIKQRYLAIATVLEKAAAYLDAVESQRLNEIKQEKTAKAQVLAEKISNAVGEPFDNSLLEKLSELSPEMSTLVQRLSGGNAVESLGGPPENIKTAGILSVNSVQDRANAADDRFIDWVTNGS